MFLIQKIYVISSYKMQTSLFVGLGTAYFLWKAHQLGYFNISKPPPEIIRIDTPRLNISGIMLTLLLIYLIFIAIDYFNRQIIKYIGQFDTILNNIDIDCCVKANIHPSKLENQSDDTKSTNDQQTKDVKISSESLGQNNVVVYKVITDKELDDELLNLDEDDDTRKITINKLNKPLNKNKKTFFHKKRKDKSLQLNEQLTSENIKDEQLTETTKDENSEDII